MLCNRVATLEAPLDKGCVPRMYLQTGFRGLWGFLGPTQTAPIGIAKGDFNHDGNQDVIVTNFSSSSLTLFLGRGDGTFEPAQTIPVGAEPIAIAVADFDRDGNLDATSWFTRFVGAGQSSSLTAQSLAATS